MKFKSKLLRRVCWLLAIGLIVLLSFVFKLVYDAGEFKQLQLHFAGTLQTVEGVTGGEDITIDHHLQLAYISADDRRSRAAGKANPLSGIYRLDLNDRSASPKLMTREPDLPIAPHGISLFQSPDGGNYLYVIDHAAPNHKILLYAIEGNTHLQLIKTFEDPNFLISPNDIAAVDEKRFYFTNDHGSLSGTGRFFEDYLQLKLSNVVYCDDGKFSFAADGIAYANGINLPVDRRQLLVASPTGKRIILFDRDLASGELSNRTEIFLGTGVDNIEFDEAGNLWIGCHPKLVSFVRHATDASRISPSQVLKLSRTGAHSYAMEVEEIFLDDGNQLSASSVAAVSGKHLLIGAVFDKKILWCQLPDQNLGSNEP